MASAAAAAARPRQLRMQQREGLPVGLDHSRTLQLPSVLCYILSYSTIQPPMQS